MKLCKASPVKVYGKSLISSCYGGSVWKGLGSSPQSQRSIFTQQRLEHPLLHLEVTNERKCKYQRYFLGHTVYICMPNAAAMKNSFHVFTDDVTSNISTSTEYNFLLSHLHGYIKSKRPIWQFQITPTSRLHLLYRRFSFRCGPFGPYS